jgi:hypothetical protein
MSNTAISAQGTTVSIGTTTGSALTITAVAQTNPCRVTLSAVTGLNKGDVLTIAAVVGTTQVNGNSYVVQYIEPTTKIVTLADLDATGFTTYVSGGTATPVQWTKISNVKSFSGFDGAASEIDRTNFDSTAKEFILGQFMLNKIAISQFRHLAYAMDQNDFLKLLVGFRVFDDAHERSQAGTSGEQIHMAPGEQIMSHQGAHGFATDQDIIAYLNMLQA